MEELQEIMHFISGFHKELGIADEEVLFLNRIDDKSRLLSYLACLLSGITFDEIRQMEEHALSPDAIRAKRCEILSGLYRDEDAIEQGLKETNARLEKTAADFQHVTDRYQKMAEESWEKERAALEETIRSKDALIEKTRAFAEELQDRILLMKKEAEKKEEASAAGKRETRRGLLWGRRKQTEAWEERLQEDRRRQREFEEDQFRDYILRNPKFSTEQKRLLLSRFLEGDSFWSIIRYAHPELSVEFMKALLEGKGPSETT